MSNPTPQPFLTPQSTTPLPQGLNLNQFIQTVLVGVSGLPGNMVRPKWFIEPSKQPPLTVNWMAIGITQSTPDASSYVSTNTAGAYVSQRHELLEVNCDIYGPNPIEIADLIRDGFWVPNNTEALRYANMGFVEVSPIRHIPDLVNERFIDRINMSVFLRREILRVYPVVTIMSASGTIFVPDISANYMQQWNVAHP